MGFLSNVLKVVGVVAAVATGGILAGAVIALASFAKGSVGKFFQSGWGKALTYATAAYSAYAGMATNVASAAGNAAEQSANTTSGFLDSFVGGAKSFVSALAHPIDTAESLFGAGSSADIGVGGTAAGGTGTLAANASETAASATADTAAAVGDTAGTAAQVANNTPIAELAQGAQTAENAAGTTTTFGGDAAAAGGAADQAGAGATAAGGMTADQSASMSALNSQPESAFQAASNTYEGNSSSNGLLAKAGKFAMSPGGGKIIGDVVQGIGNGMSQNSLMQKQIAAQNWANLQWRDPAQTGKVQAAAAAPITVPQGYLSRANAVANLANGGGGTGPAMGPQPVTGGGPGPGGAGTPMPSMPSQQQPVRAGGT